MIQNKTDLEKYLYEDAIVARCGDINSLRGKLTYCIKLFCGSEDACALRYLRNLRRYEYWINRRLTGTKWKYLYILVKCWYRYRWMRLGLRYGMHIEPNTVGYGLRIPHIAGGILINCEVMGNYCGVNSGVIIGSFHDKKPIIGNNVQIAIGAKVYGDIIIGNNVKIAPNSVVYKNIEENRVVGGNPASLLK